MNFKDSIIYALKRASPPIAGFLTGCLACLGLLQLLSAGERFTAVGACIWIAAGMYFVIADLRKYKGFLK